MDNQTIALITGAGRKGNLGYETAKQLKDEGKTVIVSGRRESAVKAIAEELDVDFVVMDITGEKSVRNAAELVEQKYGRLDVLVNNAALMKAGDTVEEQDMNEFREVLLTNVWGTWMVTKNFLPLLRKSEHPRIVNVSSGAGSYGDPVYGLLKESEQFPVLGYGISKLAENGFTVKLAKEVRKEGILVNSVCPDVTDTFGSGFGRPVEESAKSVLWAVDLSDDGPTGGFFRDGEPLPW